MALSNVSAFNLGNDQTVIQRMTSCGVQVATTVYNESAGATGHAVRAVLATKVVLDPDSYARIFALAVANDPTLVIVSGNATDTELARSLASLWNLFAGV